MRGPDSAIFTRISKLHFGPSGTFSQSRSHAILVWLMGLQAAYSIHNAFSTQSTKGVLNTDLQQPSVRAPPSVVKV